ncbi:MAG: DUF4301 family protein [Tenuifilaceae bacterium]|jgi:hypothetical protein|nr:DUF4301 family protein [Tenuifilaceae bacterium]
MLLKQDLEQLKEVGISKETVEQQLDNFRKGFPFLDIIKPAVVGDGIIRLECSEVDDLVDLFRSYEGSLTKFVPASGAATRMFKHLYEFLEEYPNKQDDCFADKGFNSMWNFFENIKSFAFYDDLKAELAKNRHSIDGLMEQKDYTTIVKALLQPFALNYGNLPKGLIKFHAYADGTRTALEEHLVEGAQYTRMLNNRVNIHLTVSPEHKEGFVKLAKEVIPLYEEVHGVTFSIEYSEQKKSTDTIAVEEDNSPFRDAEGRLVFRPGGHGALIENLNEITSEIVFIKNIDNVVPDRFKPQTVLYKKALAGLLVSYQSLVFDYLSQLQEQENPSEEFLNEVLDFTIEELCILPPTGLNLSDTKALHSYLTAKLNRPIRVCGMVKNEGEPGGGPFWAANPDGSISLQIVESSQIDLNDPQKRAIFDSSTHFNPVDLVCGVTDVDGEKFDLLKYRDPSTGFISLKSKDGRPLKAQELPGLWNGAMGDWITIFVEVPLITFNPVKTVNDLLREQHQG